MFQDNLDSVQALLKKHEDFKKSLDAHEENIRALESAAEKLTAADHYDAVTISKRRDAIVQRFVPIECVQHEILLAVDED